MKSGRTIVIGAAIAAALSAAPAAQAKLMTARFSGDVFFSDTLGIFYGHSVINASTTFTATYVYDTETGTRIDNANGEFVLGGPGYAEPPMVMSATLEIGGATYHFTSAYAAEAGSLNGNIWGSPLIVASAFSAANNYVANRIYDHNAPVDLEANYTGQSTVPYVYPATGGSFFIAGDLHHWAQGSLYPNTVEIRAAAPEPGAWALLILGFAGAGAALRRHRTPVHQV